MDLQILTHCCRQPLLHNRTSRTMILNNSMVFCAQNQVFDFSEKHDFHDFISLIATMFCTCIYWVLAEISTHLGSLFVSFSILLHDGFPNEVSKVFVMHFWRKRLAKPTRFKGPFGSCFRIFSAWGPHGGPCAVLVSILVPVWSMLPSFWHPFDRFVFRMGATWWSLCRFGLHFGTRLIDVAFIFGKMILFLRSWEPESTNSQFEYLRIINSNIYE